MDRAHSILHHLESSRKCVDYHQSYFGVGALLPTLVINYLPDVFPPYCPLELNQSDSEPDSLRALREAATALEQTHGVTAMEEHQMPEKKPDKFGVAVQYGAAIIDQPK